MTNFPKGWYVARNKTISGPGLPTKTAALTKLHALSSVRKRRWLYEVTLQDKQVVLLGGLQELHEEGCKPDASLAEELAKAPVKETKAKSAPAA